jgi:hypothetical protein
VPQVQEVWNKLNPRERLTAIGALVVVLGWIISLASPFGLGGNILALLGAIAVIVILFLKYTPSQNITWPAPISLIVLGISAVVAVVALLALLPWLSSFGGIGYFGVGFIAVIATVVGAALMAWGAWQEYNLTKPATSVGSAPSSAPPASPPPPPAPTTPPPSASDTDDLPPA